MVYVGLTQDVIDDLKVTHGKIYAAELGDQEVVFRPLTVGEFDSLITNFEGSADREDNILRAAVVYPEVDIDSFAPGEVSSLAQRVLDISGLSSPAEAAAILESARERKANTVATSLKAFIMSALPIETEEDLDNLTFVEICEKAVLAERVYELQGEMMQGAIPTLDLIDSRQGQGTIAGAPPEHEAEPSRPLTDEEKHEEMARRLKQKMAEEFGSEY